MSDSRPACGANVGCCGVLHQYHRSMQEELLAILEDTLSSAPLTVAEAYRRVNGPDFVIGDEAVRMVREHRNAR